MDDLEHWIRLAAIPSMDRLKHQQWSTLVSAADFHQLDDHQLQQLGFTSRPNPMSQSYYATAY